MSGFANESGPGEAVPALVARLGLWASLCTAVITVVSFAVAIFTPPRSGPFCTGPCVVYPYTDTAAFFPRDYLWMFPALLMTPLFAIVCTCAECLSGADRKPLSRAAMAFATISAALITLDYFVQIEVMQPSLLKGETSGLALFSQYNPHGIFIALEDLGYLMMSAAFLFLGFSLGGSSRLERALRWLLMISGATGFATFAGMSFLFGNSMETRFELAIIAINWTVLPVAAVMLILLFRRTLRAATG